MTRGRPCGSVSRRRRNRDGLPASSRPRFALSRSVSIAASRARSAGERVSRASASLANGSADPRAPGGRRSLALVDPVALSPVPTIGGIGVCVFAFAGTSTGTSSRRRRRKCFAAITCDGVPIASQAGSRGSESRLPLLVKPFVAMSYKGVFPFLAGINPRKDLVVGIKEAGFADWCPLPALTRRSRGEMAWSARRITLVMRNVYPTRITLTPPRVSTSPVTP